MLPPRILVGLLPLVVAACSGESSVEPPPGTWDLGALPKTETVLREETTPSGALVRVTAEGSGEPLEVGDAFDVRYKGYLLNGRSFDEGVLPPGIVVGAQPRQLIVGFDEGLVGIRIGGKRRILIPSALAYGAQERSGIPAHSRLVFDVERLQLKVEALDVRDGTGDTARLGSEIQLHYKGMLEDGSVFESSYDTGKPATIRLSRPFRIEGWIRGIPGMRIGGVRVLRIPSDLAFGKTGNLPKVPPNANLTFEIELLDVK